MPNLANIKVCTGCLACVDVCPTKALKKIINEEGHYSYDINPKLCIECKKCEKTCPIVSAYKYGENDLSKSLPYAGWNNDDILRGKSSSGGIFSAVAAFVLSNGGVVVGARMDHFRLYHEAIERVEDLKYLQGSKYTQSDTSGIYNLIKKYLSSGRAVLFSGLGCQVAGLKLYLKGQENIHNLFTIDLICGGVPSSFLIQRFMQEYSPDIVGIASFRNKMKYQLSVLRKDDKTEVFPLSERPLPLCGFYTEMTNRYSCYNCKFSYAHREADITIGDFWGDKRFHKEHKKGISVVIAHSDKGKELLTKSNITLHTVEWKDFLKRNFRMVIGKQQYSKKARANLANAFKNYSYRKLQEDYGNTASISQPILFSKKILRFLKRKIFLIIVGHKVNRLLRQ